MTFNKKPDHDWLTYAYAAAAGIGFAFFFSLIGMWLHR
jgi:hypothetical protein